MAEKTDYRSLKAELDEVMFKLQQDDLDVDEALELYKRGLELVEGVEKYLKSAETKVKKLKAQFEPGE
jgi:exodeoxyribonuclease VII small subunit